MVESMRNRSMVVENVCWLWWVTVGVVDRVGVLLLPSNYTGIANSASLHPKWGWRE